MAKFFYLRVRGHVDPHVRVRGTNHKGCRGEERALASHVWRVRASYDNRKKINNDEEPTL